MKKESEQKQTIYNLLASFLIGGITFLTAPIFTRLLGPAQYGFFSVAFSWAAILVCVMGLQTKEALATGHLDYSGDYYTFRNSILTLGTSISIGIIAILLLLRNPIAELLGYDIGFYVSILVFAFSQYIFLFVQQSLIFEKKAQVNLLLSVSLVISVVLFSVFFISKMGEEQKYYGRMLGFAVPYSIFALICWILLFAKKPVGFQKYYWLYSLNIGIPIVFHVLSKEILSQADKVMMKQFGTAAVEIGYYSFFFSLTSVLGTVREALFISWRPFCYDYLSKKQITILQNKIKNHVILFTAISCIFLLVAKEFSLLMAGNSYQNGIDILPLLTCCIYFTFIYQFTVDYEIYLKKTKIVASGTLIVAVVNILLNSCLIPKWGMYGAGTATFISYFLLAVGHYTIISLFLEKPYYLKLGLFITGFMILIVCIGLFFILKDNWVVRWSIAAVIGCCIGITIVKRRTIF